MSNLEDGFYWVLYQNKWIPAEYLSTHDWWLIIGHEDSLTSRDIVKAGPKIEPPEDSAADEDTTPAYVPVGSERMKELQRKRNLSVAAMGKSVASVIGSIYGNAGDKS